MGQSTCIALKESQNSIEFAPVRVERSQSVVQVHGSELYNYIIANYTAILDRIRKLGGDGDVSEVDDFLNDILISSSTSFIDLSSYGDKPDRALLYIMGRVRNKVNEEKKRTGGQLQLTEQVSDDDNTFDFSQGVNRHNGRPMYTPDADADIDIEEEEEDLEDLSKSSLGKHWEQELKKSFKDNPIRTVGMYEGTFEPLTFNFNSKHLKGSNSNNMLVAVYIYGRLHGDLVEGLGEKVQLDLAAAHEKLNFNEKFPRSLVNKLRGIVEVLSIGVVGTGTFLLDDEPIEVSENRLRALIKCFDVIFSSASDAGMTVGVTQIEGIRKDKDKYGKSNRERLIRVLKLLYLFHGCEGSEGLLASVLYDSYMGLPLQEIKLEDIRIPDIDLGIFELENFIEWLEKIFQVDESKNQYVISLKRTQGHKQKDAESFKWVKVTHLNFFGRYLDITGEEFFILHKANKN